MDNEQPKENSIEKSTVSAQAVALSLSPEQIETIKRAVSGEPTEQKFVAHVVYYLVIILFIGFAGMFVAVAALFINAWASKQASYDELMIQVAQQNGKIDMLSHEICELAKQRGLLCPAQ